MKNIQNVLIIYNPNAMKGKIAEHMPHIKQRLLLRYSNVEAVSTPVEGAEDLAYTNAPKYDMLVSCGGDGTLHEVINGVMKSGSQPIIALLPFGTCNDVARTLKIPFKLDEAIDCILKLNTTSYDIMYDGKDYITYTLATGYLTETSYSAPSKVKKKLGRMAYVLIGIKCLFKFKALPITLMCDNERIHGKFVYCMIMNGESAGGFKLNKGEVINNGKVKVVLIKKKGIASFFAFVRLFLFGVNSVRKCKSVIVRDVSHIEIENHSNTPFTYDGEKAVFLKKNIEVQTVKSIVKK